MSPPSLDAGWAVVSVVTGWQIYSSPLLFKILFILFCELYTKFTNSIFRFIKCIVIFIQLLNNAVLL